MHTDCGCTNPELSAALFEGLACHQQVCQSRFGDGELVQFAQSVLCRLRWALWIEQKDQKCRIGRTVYPARIQRADEDRHGPFLRPSAYDIFGVTGRLVVSDAQLRRPALWHSQWPKSRFSRDYNNTA